MLHQAYIAGYEKALNKLGFRMMSAGQTAGQNVPKAFKVELTKSVDKPKNLSTKNTSKLLSSPGISGPSTT